MGSILNPKIPAAVSATAAAPLAKPKTTRLPTDTDASLRLASKRNLSRRRSKRGRSSTILTDRTRDKIGSLGVNLGA